MKDSKIGIFSALTSSKWRILGIAGIVIGLAFIVNLIRTIDFSSATATIARIGIFGVIIILIPYSCAALLDSEAWRKLLSSTKRHPSLKHIFLVRAATEALVITVPMGSILSDPAKAWVLKRQYGYPHSSTAASIVFRKTMLGFSQSILAMIVAIVALCNPSSFRPNGIGESLAWMLLGLALVVVAVYSVLLGLLCNASFVDRFHRWLTKLPFPKLAQWFDRKEPHFREFNRHLGSFRDIFSVARFTATYLLFWIGENIETIIILTLLHANLTVPQAMVMEVSCVLLRASTPMVPGGIGIQDTGYASLILSNGNAPEIAAAFVLIKRFRELVWSIFGYALLINTRRHSPSFTKQEPVLDAEMIATEA
ncbi:MAG TPA: lysylphosphatidylglycerol synthase transmembrane domain-containing protein [Candidatus Kapabacteria bacterium]|jgi:uncharacterized protein (TIRG00374 family)